MNKSEHREICDLVVQLIAPIMGDYLKECRARTKELEMELKELRQEVTQQSRELVMLRTLARTQREAAPTQYAPEPELIAPNGGPLFATSTWLAHRREERGR
jgi:Tfp pilus assembly protein FimV